MKFKSEYYWFTIFAVCFISYQQIQDNIRPQYNGGNSTIKYLLGVAPNFFPAIGMPALFVVLTPIVFKHKHPDHWLIKKKHLSANLISIIGLIGWEFIQLSGKLKFDWNDVLWTLIGAFIFNIIWKLTPQKHQNI